MTLEPRQLNDADRDILDFMLEERDRVNPSYVADVTGHSRPYVSQRLKRLKEHDHVRQPHRGLWELVDDPRGTGDDSERLKRIASDGYLLRGDDVVGEYDRIELSNNDAMSFDWEIVADGDALVIQECDDDD